MDKKEYELVSQLQDLHKRLNENFDMGSSPYISIMIYKHNAIISNSFKLEWNTYCIDKNVGNLIAETILLQGLSVENCDYGDWLHNKSIPNYKEILSLKEEQYFLDPEVVKLWSVARIICNRDNVENDETIYQILYCENWTTVDEYSSIDRLKKAYKDYYEEEN